MRRYVAGLGRANSSPSHELPDGLFLVRVDRAQYRWHARKPYYGLVFCVLEPKPLAGQQFSTRLYCAPRVLWKLNWFLRDFAYDKDLLGRDEIDEKNLVGLSGVVKISHSVVNGSSLLNLDAFAPGSQWNHLSAGSDKQLDSASAAS